MEINYSNNLCGCNPAQIINMNMAFNIEELNDIEVLDKCNNSYDLSTLEFAYSNDLICWSCYMSYTELLANTVDSEYDFYVRIKVNGVVNGIKIAGEFFTDYSTSIASGFQFSYCSSSTSSSNIYNPYINMECAIALQQQLTENVACMFGIPIYYFKLAPNTGSKDLTFKEYALMDVESVKQIKLIINDNQMPSSKPEFSEFGFDWQTDWETEVSKGMFATAFGPTAQPMEGDLIYIPMMKRMWMVNEAYEEKKDAFMWNATTFKLALVKYEEKASVDLGETESLVNTFVKTKYDDLFGDEEPLDSGQESTEAPKYNPSTLYAVYQSDATRKYISTPSLNIVEKPLYYKGTLISDYCYNFNGCVTDFKVVYQRQYCGDCGVVSFIIMLQPANYTGTLISVGNIDININQTVKDTILSLNIDTKIKLKLSSNTTYFVVLRWSKQLNNLEMLAYPYTWPSGMPMYKVQSQHYYFDIDNPIKKVSKYNIELIHDTKAEVITYNLIGAITNIKVFDVYNDNISEILQMYPTHQHLLINDTARKIIELDGSSIR